MASFGRGGKGSDYQGPTETKSGKVTNAIASTEKGKRRFSVRAKSGNGSFTVDVPYEKAKNVERKKLYDFQVYEKDDETLRGTAPKRDSSIKKRTYMSDDEPTPYKSGGAKSQFKSFGNKDDRTSSSRLKF